MLDGLAQGGLPLAVRLPSVVEAVQNDMVRVAGLSVSVSPLHRPALSL